MKSKAFTLVELMVVIAILGILAGLLFPALNKMREKGRQAQCANNLKELHTATMSKVSDGGRFPYATTCKVYDPTDNMWHEEVGWVGPRVRLGNNLPGVSPPTLGFTDMYNLGATQNGMACITNGSLYGYIMDKRVYLCPTFAMEAVKMKNYEKCTPARSYVMNSTLSDANMFALTNGTVRMLFSELNIDLKWEGDTVAGLTPFVPGGAASCPVDGATVKYYTPKNTDGMLYTAANVDYKAGLGNANETIAAYHLGKGNAIFADGHIESLYWSNTWQVCYGSPF